MRFMNEWDIDEARERFVSHPVLGPATQTLSNLRDAVNANSDGWAYWPKPVHAAAKLIDLIEGDRTYNSRVGGREDATLTKLRAALTPIKSFRTRSGIQFEIVEALPSLPAPAKPTSSEPIYRTVYTVEVFSKGPFNPGTADSDPFDLETINYAITEGACIGNVEQTSFEVVAPGNLEAALLRIGNDGTFFDEV